MDEDLLKVLCAAFKASKKDQEGYANLSELGQRATAISSFSVRNYGYSRLRDLIRDLHKNFEVRTREDGRQMVKRLR